MGHFIGKYLDKSLQRDYWKENSRNYKHPIVKFFAKQRWGYVASKIDFGEISNAFDVGCGDGFGTYYLKDYVKSVKGGDISLDMLKNNPLPKEDLVELDAENLKLKDNSYDLTTTWEVLHHVPNPQKAVNEMARVSKKYVVIYEPNRANILQLLFGLLVKEERGTLRSSRRYLKSLATNSGLEVITADFCGKIPPNKTPNWAFGLVKRLGFKSTRFTGISILIIARKP